MKKNFPYEEPASELLEVMMENIIAYPQPNQSYEEDDDPFLFD
jgi:hypothetical protein